MTKNVLKSIDICKKLSKRKNWVSLKWFLPFFMKTRNIYWKFQKIGDVPLVLQQGEHKIAICALRYLT